MKKVRFTWKNGQKLVGEGYDGTSFTMEHENGKTRCLETGVTIDDSDDKFDIFTETMAEYADVEFLEQ